MFDVIFLFSVIVEINCAQPRSAFINLNMLKEEPLAQYAKLLQSPLAFSYNPDSKTSESVIDHKQIKPELPLAVRKLSSTRILMPRKYLQDIPIQNNPDKQSNFLIYVPEENIEYDSLVSSIVVPELFEETTNARKNVQITDLNSEIEITPKNYQHVREMHQKKHEPKLINFKFKFKKREKKTKKADHHATHKEKENKKYQAEHEKHKVKKSHHVEKEKSRFHDDKDATEKKFNKGEDYETGYHKEDDGHRKNMYEEDGETGKGHASKGTHNIRKKDEYVKKIEFFDEYHEDSDEDQNGDLEDDKDCSTEYQNKNNHHDDGNKHDDYAEHKNNEDAYEKKYAKIKHEAVEREKHHDYDTKHKKHPNQKVKKNWKIVVTE